MDKPSADITNVDNDTKNEDNFKEFINHYLKRLQDISRLTIKRVVKSPFEDDYKDPCLLNARICWMVEFNMMLLLKKSTNEITVCDNDASYNTNASPTVNDNGASDNNSNSNSNSNSNTSINPDFLRRELKANKLLTLHQDIILNGQLGGQDHHFVIIGDGEYAHIIEYIAGVSRDLLVETFTIDTVVKLLQNIESGLTQDRFYGKRGKHVFDIDSMFRRQLSIKTIDDVLSGKLVYNWE